MAVCKNGKQVSQSTGLPDTPLNRKKVEKDIIPAIERELDNYVPEKHVETLSYYAKIYMRMIEKTAKSSTLERFYGVLQKYVLPQFGNVAVDKIKSSDIKTWAYDIELSSSSLNVIIVVLRGVLNEALEDEAIKVNPVKVVIAKDKAKEAEPFTPEEVVLLLENAKGWFKNFLATAFYTGMRTGELIALKWGSIDWNGGFIEVSATQRKGVEDDTKTAAGNRRIPIFETLLPYFKAQYTLTGLQNGHVFCNQSGEGFYSYQSIREYQWSNLLRVCGLSYRRLYDTRSTFATNCLNSGAFTPNQIAGMLGHTNAQMLYTKYAKFLKNDMKMVDKTADIFSNKRSKSTTFLLPRENKLAEAL